ncbi:alpha/beta fold hydrolase [Streptomyces sp. NPDC005012]|uniref:alpha/beta fold hydrolase n=1 Tax=Streptomyces sp. NPDC005012 TaxID=3154558 RepID=UPI0033A931A4
MHSPDTPASPQRPAAAAVRRVREAMLRLVHPAEARLSPDGTTVAVTAAAPDHTGIVLVPAAGHGADGPAAADRAAEDRAATWRHTPRWLPDSRHLLHVAHPEDADRHPHLALLDTATGEARTLLRAPGEVEDLLLADDGAHALLLTADDGAERDGMSLGLPVRLGPAPDPERFAPGLGRRRLHLVDLATGAAREVGPEGLTVWNAAWRGGDVAVATVSEETLPSGYYAARFAALDLTTRTARTLHLPEGQLTAPAIDAEGRRAAVVEGISIVAGRPLLIDLATGEVTRPSGLEDLTWLEFADPAHEPGHGHGHGHPSEQHGHGDGDGDDARAGRPGRGSGSRPAVAEAGPGLWHAGWDGFGSRVGRVTDRGEPLTGWHGPVTLTGPGFAPALSLSADGRTAATVLDAPGRPAEAVVAATEGPDAWHWRPVTALNAGRRIDGFRTSATSWTSTDGTPVHGLLLDAPHTSAAPRPLAVLLHGGPSWLWTYAHAPGDVLGLAPALAAAGYRVLLPNPRGSSGRGLDHARAVVGDVGGGDLEDVLSGVRHLIDAGLADPDRTAVLGHSYGGHLAALAAGRTGLFRAAVVVSAPADWVSFRDTSNIGGGYDDAYAIRPRARERSAVAAEGGPGTPTLIVHGAEDRVTPVGQAHQLYRSLSRAGRAPVELYVYPEEGHEFTSPDRLLDAVGRVEAWLAEHLPGGPPADGGSRHAPGGPHAPEGGER